MYIYDHIVYFRHKFKTLTLKLQGPEHINHKCHLDQYLLGIFLSYTYDYLGIIQIDHNSKIIECNILLFQIYNNPRIILIAYSMLVYLAVLNH
jgi:hypothetical protein